MSQRNLTSVFHYSHKSQKTGNVVSRVCFGWPFWGRSFVRMRTNTRMPNLAAGKIRTNCHQPNLAQRKADPLWSAEGPVWAGEFGDLRGGRDTV